MGKQFSQKINYLITDFVVYFLGKIDHKKEPLKIHINVQAKEDEKKTFFVFPTNQNSKFKLFLS